MQEKTSLESRAGRILVSTPGVITSIVEPLDEAQLCWKPAADRWSVCEILSHLRHVEIHNTRQRTRRIIEEELPAFVDYDQMAEYARGTYLNEDGRARLEEFCQTRSETLEWLGTVPLPAWRREGRHHEVGPVRFEQIISLWAFHDLSHIRQIAEIVKAACFWEPMGGLQKYYSVRP